MSQATLVVAIEDALNDAGARLARLVVTNNRVHLVSCRRVDDALEVRISSRLLVLGSAVVDPVVGFTLGRPAAKARLQALFEALPPAPPPRRRPARVEPRGRFHDLRELARSESLRHFGRDLDVRVSWGRRSPARRRQRSIRLGSYQSESGLIRVHPLLDHPAVPDWFVGFVLFHELLHHELGIDARDGGGRRIIHPPEFRAREAAHPRFHEAMRWEREMLPLLLDGRLQSRR